MMEELTDLQEQIDRIRFYEDKFGLPAAPSDKYNMGYWLKKYLNIPDFVPLIVHMDHGIHIHDRPDKCEEITSSPIFSVRTSRKIELQRQIGKKSHVAGSPFVYYRWMNEVKKNPNAKGTVAFPTHSTHAVDIIFDWNKYAKNLLELPDYLQPVTICLYWKDLLDGHYKIFLEKGINVTTSGHIADPNFIYNFYKILSHHNYSTSNVVGSYTFYSVEMNIPFFIFGNLPLFSNIGNDYNVPQGVFSIGSYMKSFDERYDIHYLQKIFAFHEDKKPSISSEIREICLEKLGVIDAIDKAELRKVVYTQWIKHSLYLFLFRAKLVLRSYIVLPIRKLFAR